MTSSRTKLGGLLASAVDDHRKDLKEICFGRLNPRLALERSRKLAEETERRSESVHFNGGGTGDVFSYRPSVQHLPNQGAESDQASAGHGHHHGDTDEEYDPGEYDYMFGCLSYREVGHSGQISSAVSDGHTDGGKRQHKSRANGEAQATSPSPDSSSSFTLPSILKTTITGARKAGGSVSPPPRFYSPSSVALLPPLPGVEAESKIPGEETAASSSVVKHKRSVWNSCPNRWARETNAASDGARQEHKLLVPRPLEARNHYRAVRRRHESISRSQLQKDIAAMEKSWPKHLKDVSGPALFSRLLTARDLWGWLLKDQGSSELGQMLSIIKVVYEKYVEELLGMTAMTKDRLDTMNIESLIKHYNDTFKIGKDPMDSRDSKTKVIHSEGRHQVTADVVQVAFLDNLESQAAAALNKYKWTLQQYQLAVEEKEKLARVGKYAQAWLGKTRGRRHVRSATTGNRRVLEVNQLQRKVLDKIAVKDALLVQQQTRLISVTEFQRLQLSYRQAAAATDRLEQNIKSLQHSSDKMEKTLGMMMKKYGCENAQIAETLTMIDSVIGSGGGHGDLGE